MVNEMGIRFGGLCNRYIDLYFENAHTGYAEVRNNFSANLLDLRRAEILRFCIGSHGNRAMSVPPDGLRVASILSIR